MPGQISVALVGYGFAGRVFHAPIIDAVDRLQLAVIVSSDAGKVARDFPSLPVVDDVSTALSTPGVDLVVIATPNPSHYPLALKALQSGKHVVVDKPFVVEAAEADALIDTAHRENLVLSVFHNRRWDSDYRTLKHLVEQGKLGEVHTCHSHYDRYRPTVQDRWREWDRPGSGLLYDLGSHLIDQALDLMGRPDSVWADLGHQRPGAKSDDYFHVVLRSGERRAILHGGSLVAAQPFRFAVHGTLGSYLKHGLDTQEASLLAGQRPGSPGWGEEPESLHGELIVPGNEDRQRTPIPSLPGAYETYYAGMASAILDGAPVPVSAVDARNVIAIIQVAQDSARTGKTTPLAGRLR